jgi:hypothetical protein
LNFPDFASLKAASGTSKAPGTQEILIEFFFIKQLQVF